MNGQTSTNIPWMIYTKSNPDATKINDRSRSLSNLAIVLNPPQERETCGSSGPSEAQLIAMPKNSRTPEDAVNNLACSGGREKRNIPSVDRNRSVGGKEENERRRKGTGAGKSRWRNREGYRIG